MVTPLITATDIEREEPCPACKQKKYQIDFRCMSGEVTAILLFCPCGWECRGKARAKDFISYTIERTDE